MSWSKGKRETEIDIVKSKLIKKNIFGVVGMSWWQTADIFDMQLRRNQPESVCDEEAPLFPVNMSKTLICSRVKLFLQCFMI